MRQRHRYPWPRQAPLSRRAVLRGAAWGSAGLATAALIGCAGQDRVVAPGTREEAPQRGGTFRYFMANPGHLDIMMQTIKWPYRVAGLVYNRLARLTPDTLEAIPDLATAWEQPDPGTLVFKIPIGVKFHAKPPLNGRDLTARDVVFSLERIRSANPEFVHAGDFRAMDKVESPDDTTIRITTKFLDASLLTTIASPQTIVIAPETIERFSDLRRPEAQVGTGPFMLEQFEFAVGGRLVRHPQYFKGGQPYFDAVEITVGPTNVAWDMFLANRLDYGEVAREEVAGFDPKARGVNIGQLVDCGGLNIQWTFNLQRKPYDDIRVRRGLSLLINRREAIQNAWPGYPSNLTRPSLALGLDHRRFNLSVGETERLPWGWNPARKREDIQEGIQLLEAAGFTRSNPLRIEIVGDDNPTAVHGVITGEYMKGYLESVTEGRVQLSLRYLQVAAWLAQMARGDFDAAFAHFCVGFDVDHPLSKIHASDGGRNYGRWRDPEMDRLLTKERSTFEFNQRKAAVNEAQRYIADQVPYAWIGHGANVSAVRDRVRGYVPGSGWEFLEGAWFAS